MVSTKFKLKKKEVRELTGRLVEQAQAGTKEGKAEFRFCHGDGLLRHRHHQHRTLAAYHYWTDSPSLHTHLCHWPLTSTARSNLSHLCVTPSIFKIPEGRNTQNRGL